MKINIKNIGILSSAAIDINGITIIAGENNTGKSTVGKVLFCILEALNNFEARVLDAKKELLFDVLKYIDVGVSTREYMSIHDMAMKDGVMTENGVLSLNKFKNFANEIVEKYNGSKDNFEEIFKQAEKIISLDDGKIKNKVVSDVFATEFGTPLCNVMSSGEAFVELETRGSRTCIGFDKNNVLKIDNVESIRKKAVYIDDASVLFFENILDHTREFLFPLHVIDTYKALKKDKYFDIDDSITELLHQDMLAPVLKRFDEICHGRLKATSNGFRYVDKNLGNAEFSVNNLSSGLKAFALFQELVLNGSISENGTLILDEPEIHLHPEWQVVLAEMVVLMQKALGLHILITTHSPYFVTALDIYSKKHKIDDLMSFYFAQRDGNSAVVEDVSDRREVIYDSLAEPMQTVYNEAQKEGWN